MQQRQVSPILSVTGHISGIYLIFDPSLSPHYRVVCFYKYCTFENIKFCLYNSESHKWKLGEVSDDKLRLDVEKGKIFNGGISFLRYSCSSLAHFIPEGNVSEIIPNPPGHQSGGIWMNYTTESNGYLLRLTLSCANGSYLLHVSEMKGIESGWTNKYKADMKPFLGEGENCIDAMDLLGVIRGEKEQDSLLLFRLKGKMMVYRFYDGVCEDVLHYTNQDFREDQNQWWFVNQVHHFIHRLRRVNRAHHFIHSLAPV